MNHNPKKEITHYFKKNWEVMLFLVLLAALFSIIAIYWDINQIAKNILFSLSAGVISSLLYSSLTDYNNKTFYMDVLDDHQVSYHLGGRIHLDHRNLPSRKESLTKYMLSGETLKILTLTADDYLKNEENLEVIRSKVKGGSNVEILLYSPVYSLRSYIDKESDPKRFGQRRLRAVDLIREQVSLLPVIQELKNEFGEKFDIKYFTIGLHSNMIIYGSQRIFSAPIMRATKGIALPCLEYFQGVTGNDLYNKISSEFDYIWERPTLHLTLKEIPELYQIVLNEVPVTLANYDIPSLLIDEVESKARAFQMGRNKYCS